MNLVEISEWIWQDQDFLALPPEGRLGWLYLLLCPEQRSGMVGLFVLNKPSLISAMGGGDRPPAVDDFLDRVESIGWIERDRASLIRVSSIWKYTVNPNTNMLKGWWARWKILPDSPLRYRHAVALALKLEGAHDATWRSTFGTIPVAEIEAAIKATARYRPLAWEAVSKRFGCTEAKPGKGTGTVPLPFPNHTGMVTEPFPNHTGTVPEPLPNRLTPANARSLPPVHTDTPPPPPRSERVTKGLPALDPSAGNPVYVDQESEYGSGSGNVDRVRAAAPSPDALAIWEAEQAYRSLMPGAPPPAAHPSAGDLQTISVRLGEFTRQQCLHVLRVRAAEAAYDPDKLQYFRSRTLWGPAFYNAVSSPISQRAEAALAKLERVARGEPAAPPRTAAADPVAVVENKPTQEELEAFQAATAKFFGLNIPTTGKLVGEAEAELAGGTPPTAEHTRVAADPDEQADQPDASEPPVAEIEVDLGDLSDPATPHQSATAPLERASGTPVAALPDEGLENAS